MKNNLINRTMVKQVIRGAIRDPDKHIPHMLALIEKADKKGFNANGDVEPCAFIHYSNVNIHHCSLLNALQSLLFMEYKRHQPFNDNMLRPCPMLDNPEKLRDMVARSGAHSTDLLAPETAIELTAKTQAAAQAWAPKAALLWNRTAAAAKQDHPTRLYKTP